MREPTDVDFEVVYDPRPEVEEPLRLDPRPPAPRKWWQGWRLTFNWSGFWAAALMGLISALHYLQQARPH